jgi:hypothetical protein
MRIPGEFGSMPLVPLAARISRSLSRRPGAGKSACVTVPNTAAMIGR